MADIFISYASEDRERGKQFSKAFEDHGWSVWWDRNVPFGRPFDEVIRTELRAAGCVVALWTESAADSLYVIGEARDALSQKKLISVFLSHAELPYDLQAIQGVELHDWDGDTVSVDYQRLVSGIAAIVGRPAQKKAKTDDKNKAVEEKKHEKLAQRQREKIKTESVEEELSITNQKTPRKKWLAFGFGAVILIAVLTAILVFLPQPTEPKFGQSYFNESNFK